MFKRKQWVSAVRRGRKQAKYDEHAASTVGSVVKDKELEERSGRRQDKTNRKTRILKRTRKKKKGDCFSSDITNHRPSPLKEFSDSDIDRDCVNEKETEQHHVHSLNPSSVLLTTTTSSSMPRATIVPSKCCHHNDKYTSKYSYDEYSSSSSIPSSGFSTSPSHSPIRSSSSPGRRRKKKRKHTKRAVKSLTHRRAHRVVKKEGRGGRKGFTKRKKHRIILIAAVGIKLLIALLTIPLRSLF